MYIQNSWDKIKGLVDLGLSIGLDWEFAAESLINLIFVFKPGPESFDKNKP